MTKLQTFFITKDPVEVVDSHRVIGVIIDNKLSCHSHINYMCKNVSKKVYQLCRIKHFHDSNARRLFLHAHILSCTRYCSTLFDSASENATKPFVRIYENAIKAVLLASSSLTSHDYEDFNIFPLNKHLQKIRQHLRKRLHYENYLLLCNSNPNVLYVNMENYRFQFQELIFLSPVFVILVPCCGIHFLKQWYLAIAYQSSRTHDSCNLNMTPDDQRMLYYSPCVCLCVNV